MRKLLLASILLLVVLVRADEDRLFRHRIAKHHTQRKTVLHKPHVIEDTAYWRGVGQHLLKAELKKKKIDTAAKNVILFLGDGMSIATVTAARIWKGQKKGKSGEEEHLTFEKFPFTALSKTYCVDAQVADSACTATAYLTGVKTDIYTIGIDSNVEYLNCTTQNVPKWHVDSIMAWAQAVNKGTGIVTTTRVTHATPAGAYAHVANRRWEDDYDMHLDGADATVCDDIGEQLVRKSPGKNFKVIMGGGRAFLTPTSFQDPETGSGGRRRDGANLIHEWKATHPNGRYVTSRDELLNLNVAKTDSVLGLFSTGHMDYRLDSDTANNPTLEEMTVSAIRMLQKEANGFVLLVEGGRIDQAHHAGRAKFALEETVQFDNAIAAALHMTNPSETLITVTADHSHTLTISGYPGRGNPILGISGDMARDNKPYATLSYANGPGYATAFTNGERVDLNDVNTQSDTYKQPAGVPTYSETHGGDDVGIYAYGPQAHLFQGVYEQNYIAHVIGYAACIGPGLKYCDGRKENTAR